MSWQSIFKRMPLKNVVTGWISDLMEKATECTNCGLCEERCPYQLPIREMISENVANYPGLKKEWQESGAN